MIEKASREVLSRRRVRVERRQRAVDHENRISTGPDAQLFQVIDKAGIRRLIEKDQIVTIGHHQCPLDSLRQQPALHLDQAGHVQRPVLVHMNPLQAALPPDVPQRRFFRGACVE